MSSTLEQNQLFYPILRIVQRLYKEMLSVPTATDEKNSYYRFIDTHAHNQLIVAAEK